jgi:hypothetical protein
MRIFAESATSVQIDCTQTARDLAARGFTLAAAYDKPMPDKEMLGLVFRLRTA